MNRAPDKSFSNGNGPSQSNGPGAGTWWPSQADWLAGWTDPALLTHWAAR